MEGISFDEDQADIREITRAIAILFDAESIVELRVLNAADGPKKQGTVSGYFDGQHREACAEAAAYWSGKASAVYATLNPALPDILARSANRAQTWVRNTTKDNEIEKRRWLLVDFDPKRPSGISATDAEHEVALELARQCCDWLREQGWSDPILADSGNGAHLLYRIDLPNDYDALQLVNGCLAAIAEKWSCGKVDVDRKVGNAARICKLYGTLAAKGDETPDRPHRIARILDVPEAVQVVPVDLLRALCGTAAKPAIVRRTGGFDLQSWLENHNVPVGKTKEWNGGTLWELQRCPWRPDQPNGNGGPWVAQGANGIVVAGCHHNKCHGKGWADLRDVYEPGWRDSTLDLPSPASQAREAPDDPHRLARLYRDSECNHDDGPTLRYWAGQWWKWNGVVWKPLADTELNATVRTFVKGEFDRQSERAQTTTRKVTGNVVSNVVGALQSLLILQSDLRPPAWIGKAAQWPANEIVVAKNGLVHLPSLCARQDSLQSHSPRFFALNALDYAVTRDCGEPAQWLAFLGELWPEDAESIATLQQWLGYCLTSDTRHHKILVIIGPPRSGKGTIARVLTALVGPDNVAGPTLASLATNFGLGQLLGKSVAIIHDARLGNRDASIIIERLLSISGEDSLTIDRKFRDPVTLKLNTRLMIVSNELPQLTDASGALASRMIVLRLTKSFYGKEDQFLIEKLYAELPGILLWAVEGWEQLQEQGRFREPASAGDLRSDLEELGSPTKVFIDECCLVGPEYSVACADVYRAYTAWYRAKGREHVETQPTFGRNLLAALPTLRKTQPYVAGKRVRQYAGIALRPDTSETLAGVEP